jgi:hypothetical protein
VTHLLCRHGIGVIKINDNVCNNERRSEEAAVLKKGPFGIRGHGENVGVSVPLYRLNSSTPCQSCKLSGTRFSSKTSAVALEAHRPRWDPFLDACRADLDAKGKGGKSARRAALGASRRNALQQQQQQQLKRDIIDVLRNKRR